MGNPPRLDHMTKVRLLLRVLVAAQLIALVGYSAAGAGLPSVQSKREAVTNKYHAVSVVDDYQWLEKAAAPEVRNWMRLQNERTRAYFSLLPYREGIAQQLMQIRSDESARFGALTHRSGKIF